MSGTVTGLELLMILALYFVSVVVVIYHHAMANKGEINASTIGWAIFSIAMPFIVPLIYFVTRKTLKTS